MLNICEISYNHPGFSIWIFYEIFKPWYESSNHFKCLTFSWGWGVEVDMDYFFPVKTMIINFDEVMLTRKIPILEQLECFIEVIGKQFSVSHIG